MENVSQSVIESEIAELTKQIEAKRTVLEQTKGLIEEKEIVRQVVGEKISEASSVATPPPKVSSPKSSGKGSYLDSADEETTEIVNALLAIVFSKGIDVAIKEAQQQPPYILDAFHDALTDKIYDQLKEAGIIK